MLKTIQSLKARSGAFWVKMWALLAMASPKLAFAAPDFGFTPSCSDKSMSDFLVPLFGSLFSQCGGSAATSFEKAIGVLNAGALTLGGMFAAYTLVVGVMQTAHDGEMLGKRWSSMWLPIRTVLGIGLVVPVAGGYCVAQLIVAFLIGQGVGLADKAWVAYVSNYSNAQNMAPKVILPNVDELARGILRGQLCMAALNDLRAESSNLILGSDLLASSSGDSTVYGGGGLPSDVCGGVSYSAITKGMASINSATATPGGAAGWGTLNVANTTQVLSAHMNAVGSLENAMKVIAAQLVQAKRDGTAVPDISASMIAASQAYQQTVAGAANGIFGGNEALNGLVEAATNDGWYMAGSWFMKSAQMQDTINRVVSNVPSAKNVNDSALATHASSVAPYFAVLDQAYRKSSNALAPSTGANAGNGWGGGSGLSDSINRIGSSDNPVKAGISEFVTSGFGSVTQYVFQIDSNRDPLMALKDTGDYLMLTADGGILLAGGLHVIAGATEGAGKSVLGWFGGAAVTDGLRDGVRFVANMILLVAVPLLIFGAGIAIYLPMAPFLIFFGVFVGWLILCLEAVIAAPLWAIMHLTPQGDDFMGSAKGGYMLIAGLLLRPVLIVFGFIGALIAMPVILTNFNKLFFPVFKMSMTGSMVGLASTLIMVFIYFGTLVYLFHTVFSFMGMIPDKILRWMGGGGEQLGETGRGLSNAGKGHETARTAATLSQTAMQNASGLADRNSQRKLAAESKDQSAMQEKVSRAQSASENTSGIAQTAAATRSSARGEGASMGDMGSAAVASHNYASALENESKTANAAASSVESRIPKATSAQEQSAMRQEASNLRSAGATASEKASKERSSLGGAFEAMEQRAAQSEQGASSISDPGAKATQLERASNDFKVLRDTANSIGDDARAGGYHEKAQQLGNQAQALRASAPSSPPPSSPSTPSGSSGEV
jgi:conjugal transfer/type IV secretion protein DotA/TraY